MQVLLALPMMSAKADCLCYTYVHSCSNKYLSSHMVSVETHVGSLEFQSYLVLMQCSSLSLLGWYQMRLGRE